MAWWAWALVGVVALAGESVSMALFLLYVGVAAFVAALLALLGIGTAAQVGVFVVLSVLLIGLVRPRMLHALTGRVPHRALTNQGPLVDRVATVTQTVTRDGGQIRLGTAEFWSARAHPPAQEIAAGQRVRVVYVDGLTAHVEPVRAATEIAPVPADSAAVEATPDVAVSAKDGRNHTVSAEEARRRARPTDGRHKAAASTEDAHEVSVAADAARKER